MYISPSINTATLEQMGARALSSAHTVKASYDIARACIARGIPGDFVECGVFAGVQAAAMAKAVMEAESDRRVHLFDSFRGIPKAGPRDNDIRSLLDAGAAGVLKEELESSGVSVCSLEDVHRHMTEWGIDPKILVYHVGWFQTTVPVAGIERIALLRLDGDLYESTGICMKHLWPLLVPGGWCIVDDYNLDGCRAAISEAIGFPAPIYFHKHE